ncbi:hypothetical protein HPB49_000729 [Dermacentor silvarum]|uniref:Uncharacterized protein n=1 Tax=Dermacentor silvarum TaxID=543639 RepID=A0ACB8CNU4_DERSI|nr:uncharacterized protein LOC119454029 isoform X3 [Dermacentor silvarum]KAH7948677.1 hypothetical protein HPB49_000729 [Dermacentor silvarum]
MGRPGRPRLVRSPEEQLAYEQHRREQERERSRRRRANASAEDRARDAERKRQYRADPAARAAELVREAELRRRRYDARPAARPDRRRGLRAEDPAVRAREAEQSSTRKADPAVPRTAQCVVPVCHSRSAPSSILYPLPAEPTQRQAWIDFVRGCPCGGGSDWNPPTNEISFVCSLHFAVRCFWFQRRRGCTVGYSKRLRSGAVPTLYPVEEECSSAANANSPDDTAERLASSDVEDAEGRTCNSLASIQSVAGQDRGHHAIDQDAVRRLARLARFELIFPKDVSTQCSVKMASKAASCDVRTVSKSVQCSV